MFPLFLLVNCQDTIPDYDGFMAMQVHKAENAEEKDMLVACSWKNAYREPAR